MIRQIFFFFIVIKLVSVSAYAHPHVFLKNKVQVLFDTKGISGFKTIWYADDFSTAGLTDGYDENENGVLDDVEVKMFQDETLDSLKQYNYFSYLKVNGKKRTIKSIKNFKANLIDNKIVFSFIIPCEIELGKKDTEISLAQYDSSYYSFISFSEEKPVSLINQGNFQADFNIQEDMNETYYFGMVHPISLIIKMRKS